MCKSRESSVICPHVFITHLGWNFLRIFLLLFVSTNKKIYLREGERGRVLGRGRGRENLRHHSTLSVELHVGLDFMTMRS